MPLSRLSLTHFAVKAHSLLHTQCMQVSENGIAEQCLESAFQFKIINTYFMRQVNQ